jgi:hypothetical protein
LREELRPYVSENSVLKKILGSKRDKVGLKGGLENIAQRGALWFPFLIKHNSEVQ